MNRNAADIFSEARGMPPSEQAGYLNGACGGDAALRAKVEGLLKADAEAGNFPRTSGESAPTSDSSAAAPLAAPIREGPGTRIGPYKILQAIGEGGFGSVFMAEQAKPVLFATGLEVARRQPSSKRRGKQAETRTLDVQSAGCKQCAATTQVRLVVWDVLLALHNNRPILWINQQDIEPCAVGEPPLPDFGVLLDGDGFCHYEGTALTLRQRGTGLR